MNLSFRNVITYALVFACLSLTAASAVSLRTIRKHYLFKEYDRAKQELEEGLDDLRGSNRVEGLLLLAQLETDVSRAARLYREVIRTGGTKQSLSARVELAKIRYAAGDYEGAIQAVSVLPDKSYGGLRYEAIYYRGLSWKQLGEPGRARTELAAVDRGDYLYWAYMALAELDMQEGRIENAIERYETIASGRSNPIAGFKLGECYEITGDRKKALKVYQTLLNQFPNSLEAPKAREKINMIAETRRFGRNRAARKGGDDGERSETEEYAAGAGSARYTLQFGAFSDRENALKLSRALEEHALDVRIEQIASGGRIWHRVRSGMFTRRAEAEKYAVQLLKQTGYSSKVLPLE